MEIVSTDVPSSDVTNMRHIIRIPPPSKLTCRCAQQPCSICWFEWGMLVIDLHSARLHHCYFKASLLFCIVYIKVGDQKGV